MKQLNKIVLTKHASVRMKDNNLSYAEVITLWQNAIEEDRGKGRLFYDFMHHKTEYLHNVKYFLSSDYRLVVDVKKNIPIVITITKLNANTKEI